MKKVITYILAVGLIAAAAVLPACGAGVKPDNDETSSGAEEKKVEQEKDEDEEGPEARLEENKKKDKKEKQKEEQEMTAKKALEKVTINTQSSIRIDGSKKVYIDPYKRNEAVHDADLILITHAHYDHFDPSSIKNVAGDKTMIVCPDSMYKDVENLGVGMDLAAVEPGAGINPKSSLEGIDIKAASESKRVGRIYSDHGRRQVLRGRRHGRASGTRKREMRYSFCSDRRDLHDDGKRSCRSCEQHQAGDHSADTLRHDRRKGSGCRRVRGCPGQRHQDGQKSGRRKIAVRF